MKKRLFPLFVGYLLGSCVLLHAQTHPTESTAIYVASFTGEADILQTSDTKSGYEITVWLLSNGDYDYILDVADLTFSSSSSSSELNSVATSEIIENVSDAAIDKGVGLGYPVCTTLCDETARVVVIACASRFGSGGLTSFSSCGTVYAYTQYHMNWPNGRNDVLITEGNGNPSDCLAQAGCDETVSNTILE